MQKLLKQQAFHRQNFNKQIKTLFQLIKKTQFELKMESTQSAFMVESSESQSNSPEQKLRKISFTANDMDEYLNPVTKYEKQMVQGWGTNNWDLNNQSLKMPQIQSNHKNSLRIHRLKNDSLYKQNSSHTKATAPSTKKQYIQKLEQKLWELVNIQGRLQKKQLTSQSVYFQPSKCGLPVQKTSSTSESEIQKHEHNFTNFPGFQVRTNYNFKPRRSPRQFQPYQSYLNNNENQSGRLQHSRNRINKSLTSCYSPSNKHSKQVSIISYPLIEEKRRSRMKKMVRLEDFVHSFQRSNPETAQISKMIKSERNTKRQNTPIKLRITYANSSKQNKN